MRAASSMARTNSPQNGFATEGTSSPMLFAWPRRSCRATSSGTKPNALNASCTRAAVSADSRLWRLLSTLETVLRDTPASLATSAIVG